MNFKAIVIIKSLILVILWFSTFGNKAYSAPISCIICGGDMICIEFYVCEVPPLKDSRTIKRTFRPAQSKHNTKRLLADCINPDLDVNIDSTDMAQILAIGNKRIFSQTADGPIVMMDLGVASEDTQYWQMPELNFIGSLDFESIDPNESPFFADFDTSNVVYRALNASVNDTTYIHYKFSADDFLRLGSGHENNSDPYILDWYETEAFLPVECGWNIVETITTYFAFDPEIDSLVETKDLITQSTGMFTPINEDPVPAILLFLQYDFESYKDGIITEDGGYDAMVWFTTSGHYIVGYLAPGAPIEGVTQFELITYDKNIQSCPPIQDLGIDLPPGTYRAQNLINSGATLTQGPIQFVAGDAINLKNGFAATNELNLLIDPDPCNL